MAWHIPPALRSRRLSPNRLDAAMAHGMPWLETMNGERLGVTARLARPMGGSRAVAVSMLTGLLMMAYGSTSCSPSTAPCSPVLASDYDQSCTVDTDCVAVGEVSSCPAFACDGCTTEAINKSVMAQYMTAFAQAFTSKAPGTGCGCPCESGAVCRGGKCQAAFCGPPTADTLPACANAGDAGGMCLYSANATCSGMGPPDACAYSDEFCCLN